LRKGLLWAWAFLAHQLVQTCNRVYWISSMFLRGWVASFVAFPSFARLDPMFDPMFDPMSDPMFDPKSPCAQIPPSAEKANLENTKREPLTRWVKVEKTEC